MLSNICLIMLRCITYVVVTILCCFNYSSHKMKKLTLSMEIVQDSSLKVHM